jgi:hypothetical protein
MIFAKINPNVIITKQNTLFSSSTINVEYMTAVASPYRLGDTQIKFEIIFGNFIKNKDNDIIGFNKYITESVIFSSEELNNWGTDDSVVLVQIASKIGTTTVEFVTANVEVN